jgi:hypothetical protein
MAQESTWECPKNEKDWLDETRSRRLGEQSTIFDLDKYKSASKIEINQFLLLRVLWENDISAGKFDSQRESWISRECYWKAQTIFKKMKSFQSYLDSFGSKDLVPLPDLGTFSLVRVYQLSVESTHLSESASVKFTPIAKRTRFALAQSNQRREELNTSPTPVIQSEAAYDNDPSTPDIDMSTLTLSEMEPLSEISDYTPFQSERAEDEQIVNTALVNFLNAITIHHVRTVEWTLHRKSFRIGERGGQGFEARVDGTLRRRGGEKEILAIVEVKSARRANFLSVIRMQEAAQMAAWISSCPETAAKNSDIRNDPRHRSVHNNGHCLLNFHANNFSRRLLISQDKEEIFLTFATFDGHYVDYITGKGREQFDQSSFLQMQTAGPFRTDSKAQMRAISVIVLAWALDHETGGWQ